MDFVSIAHAAEAVVDSPITWQSIVLLCVSAGGTLLAIIYKNFKSDFETHRKEDRENFIALFGKVDDNKKSNADGFAKVMDTIHGMHVSLLEKLDEKADK